MKTRTTQTTTRSKSARRNGRAGRGNNPLPRYDVTFSYTQIGCRIIEARTPAEARERANHIPITQKGFWSDWPES